MPIPSILKRVCERPAASLGLFASAAMIGASLASIVSGLTDPRFAGVPRIEQGIPSAFAAPGRGPEPVLESALLGEGPFGALPQVGPDGRRPLQAYARRPAPGAASGHIAFLLTGVGLQAETTDAALALPPEVGLLFSPYAPDLRDQVTAARRAGHEVLLGLPMEPEDYPENDPGPHTLRANASAGENTLQLAWILSRAQGYVALGGAGGRFARSEAARPALEQFHRRGLGLVEIGDDRLRPIADAIGLPYVATGPLIDAEPSGLAIDYALAAIERRALASGSAIGVGELFPVTLERLASWFASLDSKGLRLIPLSTFLLDGPPLTTGKARRPEGAGRG